MICFANSALILICCCSVFRIVLAGVAVCGHHLAERLVYIVGFVHVHSNSSACSVDSQKHHVVDFIGAQPM
jgi:putative methionine-R-sulfoxide reductase with GAF domain